MAAAVVASRVGATRTRTRPVISEAKNAYWWKTPRRRGRMSSPVIARSTVKGTVAASRRRGRGLLRHGRERPQQHDRELLALDGHARVVARDLERRRAE